MALLFHHCEATMFSCGARTQGKVGVPLGEPSPDLLESYLNFFNNVHICIPVSFIIGLAEWVLLESPQIQMNCLDSKEAESSEITLLKFLTSLAFI